MMALRRRSGWTWAWLPFALACGSNGSADGPVSVAPQAGAGGVAGSAGHAGAAGAGVGGDAIGGWCEPHPCGPAPPGSTNVQGVKRFTLSKDAADVFKQARSIDGLAFSSPDAPGHCQLRPGAKKKDVVVDGPKGEDNSFGKNVVPILLGLAPDAEELMNDAIAAGEFTLALRIEQLGFGKSAPSLAAELFSVVGPAPGEPIVDWANHVWHPAPELLDLVDGDGEPHSVARFPQSYLVDDLWVSGPAPAAFKLALPIWSIPWNLTVGRALIWFHLSAGRNVGSKGVISGVIDTAELVASLRAVGGKVSPVLCDTTIMDNVVSQLESASDIMRDGTQKPDEVCDAISFGLGFESEQTKLGSPAPPARRSDACLDHGPLP